MNRKVLPMTHTLITPGKHGWRRRPALRLLLLAAPVAVLGGCISLATREAEYRQRKVALEPLARDESAEVAGVGGGME